MEDGRRILTVYLRWKMETDMRKEEYERKQKMTEGKENNGLIFFFAYTELPTKKETSRDDCMEFNDYVTEIHVSFELKTVFLLIHLKFTIKRYSNQKTKLV